MLDRLVVAANLFLPFRTSLSSKIIQKKVIPVGWLVVATALFYLPVRPVHGLEEMVLEDGLVVASALFLPGWPFYSMV